MLKVNSYSTKGTKLAAVTLPKDWEEKMNLALLSQVMHVYQDRLHIGLAKAKTRGEVNRTTKKWYAQKHTGGARHGARSAPIFVGGGVAHGPRPLRRELNLSDRMRKKALGVAISLAVKEGKVSVAQIDFKKTSEANKFVEKVFGKNDPRVTFVISKENLKVTKFLRNIKNVKVILDSNMNAYDVFFGGNIVMDKQSLSQQKQSLASSAGKSILAKEKTKK